MTAVRSSSAPPETSTLLRGMLSGDDSCQPEPVGGSGSLCGLVAKRHHFISTEESRAQPSSTLPRSNEIDFGILSYWRAIMQFAALTATPATTQIAARGACIVRDGQGTKASGRSFFGKSVFLQEIQDPAGSLDSKLKALQTLSETKDAELPGFIVAELQRAHLNVRWRAALVHAAERMQSRDTNVRARLVKGLLYSARVLRGTQQASAQPSLWAAIRTLGGLIKASDAGMFLEFLGDDRLPTRQVALQALQGILAKDQAAAAEFPVRLKARVGQLARIYLNPEFLVSGETIALAANAYCVALLARVSNIDDITLRLEAMDKPVLKRQIRLTTERARGHVDA